MWSVLLLEETGEPREKVASSTLRLSGIRSKPRRSRLRRVHKMKKTKAETQRDMC